MDRNVEEGLPVHINTTTSGIRVKSVTKESEKSHEATTFQQAVDSLEPALRRLVGQYQCKKQPKLGGNKRAVIATNGSVKDHRGGAGLVIDDGQGGEARECSACGREQ